MFKICSVSISFSNISELIYLSLAKYNLPPLFVIILSKILNKDEIFLWLGKSMAIVYPLIGKKYNFSDLQIILKQLNKEVF